MPLTQNNIESELGYAYLHAVASKAGLNCYNNNRHSDGYGTDATVEFFDKIPGTYITDVHLRIQLKSTYNYSLDSESNIKFELNSISLYNKLREFSGHPRRILVVLLLPDNPDDWLKCSPEELVLKKAAYWVSLYDAPATNNKSTITIKLPKGNLLTPENLISLCMRIAKDDVPKYEV
jgi:hypothetical protein